MNETAAPLEVFPHALGIDNKRIDDAPQARERKSEGEGRVGRDHGLDRGMRDVALMPERHVLHGRQREAAYEPRKPGQILRQDRIAFVRHGGRALLALREELLGLAYLRALQ